MAYRHGVYTSEVSTSIQTAAPVDSALPFVIGTAPRQIGPVLITSWARYCAAFGVPESVDISGPEFSRGGTLTNFAYYWFILAGRSDCILQSLPGIKFSTDSFSVKVGDVVRQARYDIQLGLISAGARAAWRDYITSNQLTVAWSDDVYSSDFGTINAKTDSISALTFEDGETYPELTVSLVDLETGNAIAGADLVDKSVPLLVRFHAYGEVAENLTAVTDAIQSIHTLYERFGRVASILLIPGVFFTPNYQGLVPAMAAAVSNIGGRFKGIALAEIPAGDDSTEQTGVDIDVAKDAKQSTSPYVVYAWPNVGVGDFRFPASVALAAAINATDGQHGGLPYVSPSNKPLPVTGAYCVVEDADGFAVKKSVFATRDDVNAYLGAYGIVGFRNTAQGWVAWGDNTAAFPGSTDVKDYMIPIRRMFNYVSNQFQVFADSRVDMPLNMRQLEGVVKSFNQILAGWVGFGALNAGSVELDSDLNTTESLLSGTVYVRIRIAPPPAMVVIEGVLEYDVRGFERSLA